jgi:hypothetical protein
MNLQQYLGVPMLYGLIQFVVRRRFETFSAKTDHNNHYERSLAIIIMRLDRSM